MILAVTKKLLSSCKTSPEKFWGFNGIWTHALCNTGAMPHQLGYEASLEAGQVRVQFIPVIWREWHVYVIKIIWVNCGLTCPVVFHIFLLNRFHSSFILSVPHLETSFSHVFESFSQNPALSPHSGMGADKPGAWVWGTEMLPGMHTAYQGLHPSWHGTLEA